MKHERQLLAESLDDQLSPEDQARLDQWLLADSDNAREFIFQTHLHYSLHQLTRANLALNESEKSRLITFPQLAPFLALAASLLLLGTLLFWYFSARVGSPVIAQITGAATIERAGQALSVQPGLSLLPGDKLHTASTSTVAVTFAPENTTFTLSPSTDLHLLTLLGGKRFHLVNGKLDASVARQRLFHPMLIRTPQAEARVLGTEFTLESDTNSTRLEVVKGTVRLTGPTNHVDVSAGNYALAGRNVKLASLPQTGSILCESWTNHTASFAGVPSEEPARVEPLNKLEISPFVSSGVCYRLRGYFHPPVTGPYVFSIAASHHARMYIGRNESPQSKEWLATANATSFQDWTKNIRMQRTDGLMLQAGRMYYLEVEHNSVGETHLSVACKGPDGTQRVITGQFLSPFHPSTPPKGNKTP